MRIIFLGRWIQPVEHDVVCDLLIEIIIEGDNIGCLNITDIEQCPVFEEEPVSLEANIIQTALEIDASD